MALSTASQLWLFSLVHHPEVMTDGMCVLGFWFRGDRKEFSALHRIQFSDLKLPHPHSSRVISTTKGSTC